MTPRSVTLAGTLNAIGRVGTQASSRPFDPSDHAALEANSHLPEVQMVIREAVRRAQIRVRPDPGSPDRVKILPVLNSDRVRAEGEPG